MNYYRSTTLIFATELVVVVEKSPHIFVARGEVSYADYIVRIEKENQNFFHIITEGLPDIPPLKILYVMVFRLVY